ncbi:MAG: HNH endonuclease family protein, partial [Nostoc sp.]|uniref:HNH endonuclease family protein n=1 Tax=Nostoc sp. TaxID=1180 RepID=UPI002FF7A216
ILAKGLVIFFPHNCYCNFLLSHAIYIKDKSNEIKPINEPQQLIDKILIPYGEAFYEINNLAYHSDILGEEVNQKFRWLHLIDNSDWIPPAILYLSRNYSNPELLLRFFTDLDRLASGLMIQRNNINERIERYGKLLYAIEIGEDLYVPDSPLQLKPEEQVRIIKILNDDLYLIRKIRLYVLLRLDAALSEGKASYNFCNISVEHVLPQNPTSDSMWVQSFPSQEERDKYVHRMGNLVLLSSSKNAQAQNYDFDLKKQKYFTTKSGICNFALTTQVLMEKEWTPEVINKRQQQLIHQLKEVWRLQ